MKMLYQHKQLIDINVKNLSGFYTRVANEMAASVVDRMNKGIGPDNAPLTVAVKKGSKTLRDNGNLITSISGRATSSSALVGTNHIAARINHFGGTIKAKKTWLFIPASAKSRKCLRSFGHGSIGSCIKSMRSAGYNVWFQTKGTKGVVLVSKKSSRKTKAWVLFILKKSVKIPARPFLTITEEDRRIILKIAENKIGVTK